MKNSPRLEGSNEHGYEEGEVSLPSISGAEHQKAFKNTMKEMNKRIVAIQYELDVSAAVRFRKESQKAAKNPPAAGHVPDGSQRLSGKRRRLEGSGTWAPIEDVSF